MYAAGFETTSATISYCLLELALNPQIQQRLRNEIDAKTELDGGKLTYENLKKMDFLEMVLRGRFNKRKLVVLTNIPTYLLKQYK